MAPTKSAPSTDRKKRRPITVYDAVAGRVGYEGFITDQPPSKYRDTTSSTTTAVPPEEVLFRRKHAPVRYEEDDIYFANKHLEDQKLPDSDLLKAIHAYASDFYAAKNGHEDGEAGFESLDETALLAIGILLEEATEAGLGETDCLAFVKGAEEEPSQSPTEPY